MQLLAFLLAISLAFIHLLAGKLQFLNVTPRSRWLSCASGISVAYVFIHLLPKLAEGQRKLEETNLAEAVPIESLVWIVALLGLAVFYGLERRAKISRKKQRDQHGQDKTEREVFWLHAGSYGFYNLLIGYLLLHRSMHRNTEGISALIFFWLAMALHFFVNDYGLRRHHREQYTNLGRWVLAIAVVAGWVVGFFGEVSEVNKAIVYMIIAFLGGGVVMNVLKEELPEERKSQFWPFAIGAAAYTALLLAT